MRYNKINFIVGLVLAFPWTSFAQSDYKIPSHEYTGGFFTNDAFINGLYQRGPDISNAKEVLGYILERLPSEVTIYPSENYYYFTFTAKGKLFKGSLSLFTHNRDSGVVDIGYIEVKDNIRQHYLPSSGGYGLYTAKDSFFLKKINDFCYSLSYRNRQVIFDLYQPGLKPPQKARLIPDEVYVGPSFDESGLKFFLVYNKSQRHLYWLLNEDDFVAETFYRYTADILIGERTSFAFYNDTANTRKILIGVKGENVLQNNWYDGPFDQMPDNYVYSGQLEVRQYLENSYPGTAGRIDKYGNYLEEKGSRIAVAPYLVYFSENELAERVKICKTCCSVLSVIYSCLTEQQFSVPENFYND